MLFDAAAWFVVAIAVLTFVLRLRRRLLFPITDANGSLPGCADPFAGKPLQKLFSRELLKFVQRRDVQAGPDDLDDLASHPGLHCLQERAKELHDHCFDREQPRCHAVDFFGYS
jgi:hypothetical protein